MLPAEAFDYVEWAAAVKANGGDVVAMPGAVPPPAGWNPFKPSTWFGGGRGDETIPAARYYMTVWVPKVNARIWSQPDAYSRDGKYGYYAANEEIIMSAHELSEATLAEVANASRSLVPEWFKNASTAVKWGVGGLGLLVLLEVVQTVRDVAPRRNRPRRRRDSG